MKQISLTKLADIVDTYGGKADRWPHAWRPACLELIERDFEAKRLVNDALELDEFLDMAREEQVPNLLRQRILTTVTDLPQLGRIERMVAWLIPDSGEFLSKLWRPAFALTLPLVMGIVIGMHVDVYSAEDQWALWEEEIYLSGLNSSEDGDFEDFWP